ncbi:MAG TPA: alpha/beta hydrolase [Planctomycetota bacterium]|nr:alpha/beta hydrolase [Planctomycetota bacterium]
MKIACALLVASVFLPHVFAADDHTFDSNGVKIHYVVEGKGEPVVLIHGLFSSAMMNWQLPGVVVELAKNHQVIALDARGHGASDKPDKEEAYGAEMAEDVARLIDHLQIKKAHIVGYSMGGMIAMKFITKHPDRVLSGLLGGMGWLREGGLLEKVWDHMGSGSSGGAKMAAKTLGKLAVSEAELKAVSVPIEVLVGDRDPCKALYVAPLQTVRSDWPVIEIKGAGHMDCILKPEFKTEIVKWLAKQEKK